MSSIGVLPPGGGGGVGDNFICLDSVFGHKCKTTNMADQDGQEGQKVKDLIHSFRTLDNVEKTLFMLSCVKECKTSQLKVVYEEVERILANDFVNILPTELAEKIFSYLDAKSLCRVSCVNRKWRRVSNNNKIWYDLCKDRKWHAYCNNRTLKHPPDRALSRPSSASRKISIRPFDFNRKTSNAQYLDEICEWKELYIKVFHLQQNWVEGLYAVKPILRGHKQPVTCLDCDGEVIASGSLDATVVLWDINSLECKVKLTDFGGAVKCLKLKDNHLVTGCIDSVIRVFSTKSFNILRKFDCQQGSIEHICFEETIIANTVSGDRDIRIWSIDDNKNDDRCLHRLEGHTDDIEVLQLWNGTLVSTSWDGSVRLWCVQTGQCLHSLFGHTEVVMCCQMDDEKIMTGGADGNVIIWDTNFGHLRQTLYGHAEVYCLQFNEKVIVSGSADSLVRVWSIHGRPMYSLQGHIGIVRCIRLQGSQLVSGGDCKKVIVWDAEKGELLNFVHRHPTSLHLMWTDETRIVTASPETPGTVTVVSYWS
ncbi:F-box/WD repeat-containing protein 7-like [Rhopilema esculentum]|uniref:F-box/WD repeat-containing protein 7-like n=1 Tax=Rhopilema esculentum TaxID=499914 RepID=UPI0031D3A1C9